MASLVRVYNSKNIANGSHAKYTLNWDSVESFKSFARSTPLHFVLIQRKIQKG